MLFQPYTPAPHPSPASSVCSDCNYTVGLNVWLDVVTGMCGDIHETARQCFFLFFFQACLPLTSRSACQTYGPLTGRWGAAGDCCVDWWWQRWPTTAVWTPVSTYWPNSLKTRPMPVGTQKSKSEPRGWFSPSSFHITLSPLSYLRRYWSESSIPLWSKLSLKSSVRMWHKC